MAGYAFAAGTVARIASGFQQLAGESSFAYAHPLDGLRSCVLFGVAFCALRIHSLWLP